MDWFTHMSFGDQILTILDLFITWCVFMIFTGLFFGIGLNAAGVGKK